MFSDPDAPGVRRRWRARLEASGRTRLLVLVAAGLAVAAIGLVDYATGPLLSMSVFYLVPAAWATSILGRRAGLALAALSGISGIVCDVVLQPHYRHRGAAAWNVALMLITLIVVVELVDRSRRRAFAALASEQRGREFLAFAAHQLRTPLAGMRASVDALMLGSDGDAAQEQLLAGLGTETLRAGRLVASLLRVARLDQHEELPMRRADVVSLVGAEVGRAERSRPSVVFRTIVEGPGAVWVDCNPEAVAEAVTNLLDNAGRHARSEVTVDIRSGAETIEIAVHDDGPGLAPGPADAVFQRFVTLDGHGGTGLGLPIARGIAEVHGGTLVYERGSFVIRLPVHRRTRKRGGPVAPPDDRGAALALADVAPAAARSTTPDVRKR